MAACAMTAMGTFPHGLHAVPAGCQPTRREGLIAVTLGTMTGLAVVLLIVGVVLLLLGVFIEAAKFLLWIGLVIVVIAVIAWLMRFIRRQT